MYVGPCDFADGKEMVGIRLDNKQQSVGCVCGVGVGVGVCVCVCVCSIYNLRVNGHSPPRLLPLPPPPRCVPSPHSPAL